MKNRNPGLKDAWNFYISSEKANDKETNRGFRIWKWLFQQSYSLHNIIQLHTLRLSNQLSFSSICQNKSNSTNELRHDPKSNKNRNLLFLPLTVGKEFIVGCDLIEIPTKATSLISIFFIYFQLKQDKIVKI